MNKESCYYHRNLLPTAWKCDLFCSNVVEICWDWKIDYSFLKRAQCFVASTSMFYLGWFRFCLCCIGANNASALIPPSYLNSQIMWTFVIWAPGCHMLVLRFKIHKQDKELQPKWNHADPNIMDCASQTEVGGLFQPNLILEMKKQRPGEKWLLALWAIQEKGLH